MQAGATSQNHSNDGKYKFDVVFPAKMALPLMIKLTFYNDKDKFGPPRWIEHLATRIPKGDSQKLHVVLYTDEQLKKANLGELYLESQQLDTSMFFWMEANENFKQRNKAYFLFQLLDNRRKLILSL
jgi:hypothetical protein